jgi:ABC-type protease/lipase transport system fused ATPase/permease subunit
MGIFGFLSKAHLDQVQPSASNEIRVELIQTQIDQQNTIISRSQNTLTLLDKTLEKYIDMEYVTRGLKEREKQKPERDALNLAISNAIDEISKLTLAKSALELQQEKIEAEVGPIKYIAELIYGDTAKDHFDEAVRWVIIVLIFVFDPLAVLLLIAANISLRSRNLVKEEEKTKVEKDYQKEATNAKVRAKRVRDREKIYKDILKKIGTGELKSKDYDKMKKLGLNPDEIRIKLNQIMDLS